MQLKIARITIVRRDDFNTPIPLMPIAEYIDLLKVYIELRLYARCFDYKKCIHSFRKINQYGNKTLKCIQNRKVPILYKSICFSITKDNTTIT